MPSTFAGLNTMVKGIVTNQISLNTVGHNITNGSTPGYSRQSVNQVATPSEEISTFYGGAQLGTGVDAQSITRARDVYADRQYWLENSNKGYYDSRKTNYSKVESVYNDSSSTGLANKIATFWKSWQTLGQGAGADSYDKRVAVYEAGNDLANSINSCATEMQNQIKSQYDDLKLKVGRVNEITNQILSLNKNIVQAEAGGGTANDLRDTRDNLVDELSGYAKVNVTTNKDGTYTIVSNGTTLVDGKSRLELECGSNTSETNNDYGVTDYSIMIKGTTTAYDPGSGTLKGIQDSVAEDKQGIDDLSKMSAFLLTTFNDMHKSGAGIDSAATTGINFFGASGRSYAWDEDAGQVTVNGANMTSIQTILALQINSKDLGSKAGKNLIASRAQSEDVAGNSVAVSLSNLFSKPSSTASPLEGIALNDYYTGMMSSLGSKSKATNNAADQQDDMMTTIDNNRQSTSGVNWNEELTNMIRYQQGYSACSKCLTTMDSMLDKLINSVN